MFIINHKNIFFAISAMFVVFSVFAIFFWGLNPSIEFTGGSIIEITFPDGRPDTSELSSMIAEEFPGNVFVQPTGEFGYIIRMRELGVEEHPLLLETVSRQGAKKIVEERYNLIGPSIGKELRMKAFIAIGIVLAGIILFIAFAFRGVSRGSVESVSRGVSSWHYGFAAIVALVHDVIIPTGIFSFLGSRFVDAQIDVLFVTALLAILGYSVHDTIVVFDRVRENLRKNQEFKLRTTFEETVGESLMQTMGRSINTSLTTLLALLALYFLGSEATKNFALVLSIGIIVGTYSSIFLASPLLVALAQMRRKP